MGKNGKVVIGGLPYGPDLQRLRDRFGAPETGTLILYPEIEAVIGAPWRSSRFSGVVGAWKRKLQREHNLILVAEPGKGLHVLTAPERLTHGEGYLRQAARRIRDAHGIIGTTPHEDLDEAGRDRANKLFTMTTRHFKAIAADVKSLAPPKAVVALPR